MKKKEIYKAIWEGRGLVLYVTVDLPIEKVQESITKNLRKEDFFRFSIFHKLSERFFGDFNTEKKKQLILTPKVMRIKGVAHELVKPVYCKLERLDNQRTSFRITQEGIKIKRKVYFSFFVAVMILAFNFWVFHDVVSPWVLFFSTSILLVSLLFNSYRFFSRYIRTYHRTVNFLFNHCSKTSYQIDDWIISET